MERRRTIQEQRVVDLGRESVTSCPKCAKPQVVVGDSRPQRFNDGVEYIRRRRSCAACLHRWSTVEIPAELYDVLSTRRPLRLRAKALAEALREFIGEGDP